MANVRDCLHGPRLSFVEHNISLHHLIEGKLLEVDALRLLPGGLVEKGQHRRLAGLEFYLGWESKRKRETKATSEG